MNKIFGIDLGTTNSLIGSGDTLYSGLVASNVNISTGSQCSRDTYGDDIVSSYKINMTTGTEGQLPIKCSSIILKELAKLGTLNSGVPVKDVIISVPAEFTHTQRQAVKNAGEMAGLNVITLINEPTAAALYVCKNLKDLVVVYDLGGGTFDVTIIDARAGNYFIVATDGNSHLAGDNFDRALVEAAYNEFKIKIRYRGGNYRKKFTTQMRKAKEALQRSGCTQFVSLEDYGVNGSFSLTVDKYCKIMRDTFAETVRLTNYLIKANLNDTENPKLVFVGGSTACPYLRDWVKSETGLSSIDCDTAPDLLVAKGAALYAEMYANGLAQKEVEDVTKRLCIEDAYGSTITLIDKNTTIPTEATSMVSNNVDSQTLELNLYQGDSILASGCDYIGTLIYDYGRVMKANDGYVEVKITVGYDGRVSLMCSDLFTGHEQKVELVMR